MNFKVSALLLALSFLGAGCNNSASMPSDLNQPTNEITSSTINTTSKSTSTLVLDQKEKDGAAKIEDVAGFLLTFQEIADLLADEGGSFKRDSINPDLQTKYTENGSDVPLMRFLGRRGLNNIESKNLAERITYLKKQKSYSSFSGSVDRLDKALIFLRRFYTGIEDLRSFEDFKTEIADFISYQDSLLEIGDILKREYEVLQSEQPSLNFQMADSIASLIVQLYSRPSQPTSTPPSVPAPKPNSFTNNEEVPEEQERFCCKICSKGKACGDSCISRSYTCYKAPGCACDS
jgi:hypothetical protein